MSFTSSQDNQQEKPPTPRYCMALLRRQSNTLYLIASSLGQCRIIALLRHTKRGDILIKAMWTPHHTKAVANHLRRL